MTNQQSIKTESFFDLAPFQQAAKTNRLDQIRARHEELQEVIRGQQMAIATSRFLVFRHR